jgi:hypothetical protein
MMADREEELRPKDKKTPPGDFLSEDLRDETARFLDEVKRQIKTRKEPREEPKLGPPRRDKRR